LHLGLEIVERSVLHDAHPLVIIEPGAAHVFILERKSERMDKVQIGAGIGAQAYNIAGVLGDLRLIQDYNVYRRP
jgi:hypothetical protein